MNIREILLLHHTHTDVGYTHPQPVFWNLQQRIINEAIDLCESTADFPEPSRVRWTCETTWPLLHWLNRASGERVERFRALAKAGQIAVGAFPLHLSPLANLSQFAHGLRAVRLIRDELGVPASVAISHDVNGIPWPVVDLMLDAGIEGFLMGINIHSGGFPYQRPRWMQWQGPDARRLLTYNGMHYNTFGRESRYAEGSTEVMQECIDQYLGKLEAAGLRQDFVTLTTTNPAFSDNYPPDPLIGEMVRRWNDEGRQPLIRFATPEMVVARGKQLPVDDVPVFAGDWSDYWNFGSASSATETRVNRNTARRLLAAGMLRTATTERSLDTTERSLDAWRNLVLFDEHTWGADRMVQSLQTDIVDEQWILNAAHAWRARSLTGLLMRDAFEELAANPLNFHGVQSLMCFNPTPFARDCFVRVPNTWVNGAWRHNSANSARIEVNSYLLDDSDSFLAGPFHLEPNSLSGLPVSGLVPATPCQGMSSGTGVIETAFHRLRFDPVTGLVTSLHDKSLDREFIDPAAEWPFFGYVHEMPDPAHHVIDTGELGRDAYYESNWDLIHADVGCWQYDWKALRRGPGKLLSVRIEHEPDGITLVTMREAPGVRHEGGGTHTSVCQPGIGFPVPHVPDALIQRIKLCGLRPVVELTATFKKDDTRHAEAIYFAFPLDLTGWSAHYDACGIPTKWDEEQLDGSCKNWVTTGSYVSVHNSGAGVTLATPDAPLVQIGDFGFGRPQGFAKDKAKPLLLGWAVNNYWMTNFRPSQPGPMRFRYELRTHGAFDPVVSTHAGLEAACPIEIHPADSPTPPPARSFIKVSHPAVIPVRFAPCDDETNSLLVYLQNVSSDSATAEIELPELGACRIYQSNALAESVQEIADGPRFSISLQPRATCILRVDAQQSGEARRDPLHALWRAAP